MASDWKEVSLGGIGRVVTGKTPKTKVMENFGHEIPFITPRDMDEQRVISETERYLSKVGSESVKNSIIPANSVLVSCIGSDMGKSAIAKYLSVTNQQINSIVVSDDFYYKFVYYNLSSRKTEIKGLAGGSAQPILNKSDFSQIKMFVPPLSEQKAIAHILGSLDDKIELNRQMNETLESMAQALFKSWFVDFDPVLDNALAVGKPIPEEFIERSNQRKAIEKKDHSDIQNLFPDEFEFTEEMGWIPKGWAVSEVGTEFNTVGGGTPSTKNLDFWENGNISWTTPKDLSGNQSKILLHTDRKITELGLKKISSGLLPIDTVLMSSRAPVGYLALAKVPVAINQGYIALKCEKTLTPEFAIQWADLVMDEIKQRAGGTTFAEISKTNFRGIPILVPSKNTIDAYSRDVKDLYNQITSRIENIDTLAKLRDTLLTKLMSGELRISDTL